jgi:hypothetical protein
MATAALVCGIVGVVMCFFAVPSIVALVLGLIAASRAKQSGDPRAGLGRARAGWILGAVGTAFFIVFIGTAIAGGFDDESVDVYDLDVGDCVNVPDDAGRAEISRLDELECSQPHDAEVFAVDDVTIDDDDYPGEAAVTAAVEDACTGEVFAGYVGRGYLESRLDVYYLIPTEQMWERADARSYMCMAVAADSSPLTGSVEGSGR